MLSQSSSQGAWDIEYIILLCLDNIYIYTHIEPEILCVLFGAGSRGPLYLYPFEAHPIWCQSRRWLEEGHQRIHPPKKTDEYHNIPWKLMVGSWKDVCFFSLWKKTWSLFRGRGRSFSRGVARVADPWMVDFYGINAGKYTIVPWILWGILIAI